MLSLGSLVLALALVTSPGEYAPQARHFRDVASTIQRATWRELGYAGGALDCRAAPYISYRRDTINTGISDHWYVALHLRADAALARLGDRSMQCHIDKTVAWMEKLWSPVHSGYSPRANLDGREPTLRDVYADDNAIIGLAFLEAVRVSDNPATRGRARIGAERASSYLTQPALWDDVMGGGLWWNDQPWSHENGKPAQTAALTAQLMAELYEMTGNPRFRELALKALNWLDAATFDRQHGLYAYGVVENPLGSGNGQVVATYFGYDQAIVIEALMALYRVEPRGEYLARAQRLAAAIDREFWHPRFGGYTLEAGNLDVYASYGAWLSEGYLSLYAADGNPIWRALATTNFEAINRALARGDGIFANMLYPCGGVPGSDCSAPDGYARENTVFGKSQAMMQRVAARLSAAHERQDPTVR
jgi:hypothetical protein